MRPCRIGVCRGSVAPTATFAGLSAAQRGVNPANVRGSLDKQAPTVTPFGALPRTEQTAEENGDVAYQGGPVLHTASPYLILLGSLGGVDRTEQADFISSIDEVAADTQEQGDTYGVGRQYYDSAGYADAGQTFSPAQAILDQQPSRPNKAKCIVPEHFTACVTDAQVQAEITRLIETRALPTDGPTTESEFPATPRSTLSSSPSRRTSAKRRASALRRRRPKGSTAPTTPNTRSARRTCSTRWCRLVSSHSTRRRGARRTTPPTRPFRPPTKTTPTTSSTT